MVQEDGKTEPGGPKARRLDRLAIDAENDLRVELVAAIKGGDEAEIDNALGAWGAALIEKVMARVRNAAMVVPKEIAVHRVGARYEEGGSTWLVTDVDGDGYAANCEAGNRKGDRKVVKR